MVSCPRPNLAISPHRQASGPRMYLPDKAALRRFFWARRRLPPAHWRAHASARVGARLLRLAAHFGWRHVAFFWPLPGEIDLVPSMRLLWRQGCRLYLPRQTAAPAALHFVAWAPGARLRRGRRGLWQPVGPAVAAARLQAVVMPGLAFDLSGARLGQGGGAYDRALVASRAPRVGVAWDECVLPSPLAPLTARGLPRAPHDLLVSWLLSPGATRRCPAPGLVPKTPRPSRPPLGRRDEGSAP